MSEQDGTQSSSLQRPTSNKPEVWKAYWKKQDQSWRIEPEIDAERQKYHAEHRSITPNIEQGIYPFRGIKLSRADIEWLLATHENGRGPVDWSYEHQREREGLDLRGADLRGADLRDLPLARICGGLTWVDWAHRTEEQHDAAAVLMEGAVLSGAHLEGATLIQAHLERTDLRKAHLERTDLRRVHLERADLWKAHLEGAILARAHLDEVLLDGVVLSDEKHIGPQLADIRWNDVNLTVVNWSQVEMLGDEYRARQKKDFGKAKDKALRISQYYYSAIRSNRQLAVALRDQGMNDEADHFAYRAQLLQRKVLWHQQNFGRWLFSLLLAMLSGYGYRIWRILVAYVLVVSLFAVAYFVLGLHYPPHLPLVQAFLESITAFHGRVFLEQFNPNTPQIWLTALEAIMGLVIEGVFIAMLIQRFFGK